MYTCISAGRHAKLQRTDACSKGNKKDEKEAKKAGQIFTSIKGMLIHFN